jgi:hypothetical protein
MGREVDGAEVSVEESQEKFNQYVLEDGTVLKLKTVLVSIVRIDGQYDSDGNPAYVVKTAPVVGIVSAPETLRRKLQ